MNLDKDRIIVDIEMWLDDVALSWEHLSDASDWIEYRVQTHSADYFTNEAEILEREIDVTLSGIDWDYEEDGWGSRTYYGKLVFYLD